MMRERPVDQVSRIRSIALGGAEVFVCLFESILYAEEMLTSRVPTVTDTLSCLLKYAEIN